MPSTDKKLNAVAIDGPAGSGKSTVSRRLARELGYVYIDTGAMYRALTLKAMRTGTDLEDEVALIELSRDTRIELLPSDEADRTISVLLDGEDVSVLIRDCAVTANVKYIARVERVRDNMVQKQRRLAMGSDGSVMEGRDITTVVLPDAAYKFYLDASFEQRVQRRFQEIAARGEAAERKELEADLAARDHADRTRSAGPLRKSEDAVLVDTTDMSVDEVVLHLASIVRGGG